MRSRAEMERTVALLALGLSDLEVSRRTGIPRSTIRGWRKGGIPRHGPRPRAKACPICAPDGQELAATEDAYLLGLYLGDGYVARLGPGRKHERPIRLALWQENLVSRDRQALIRGLIHSDGCRVVANDRGVLSIRYHFSNRSEDIKRIFCDSLDALGIDWTRPCDRQIAIYRKASTALLDEFVGPKC